MPKNKSIIEERSNQYGNKTANLYELQSVFTGEHLLFDKLRVPEFYSLSNDFIQEHLNRHVPKWRETFEQFKTAQQSNKRITKEASQELEALRKLIIKAFEEHLIEDPKVHIFLEILTTKNATLMVRSTGEEDTADAANPGGNKSIAGVSPNIEAVTKAIGQVIASYFSEKSLKQRLLAENNDITKAAFVPVLLQRMVGEPYNGAENTDDIVRSGVMYTSKTLTKIQAAPGHGDAVVNNQLTVDTYRVTREQIVYSAIAKKAERLVPTEKGLQWKKNPKFLQNTPALPEDVVLRLEQAAQAIEDHYGEAMDVEFVYDVKEDIIYLVQARPIPAGLVKSVIPCSIPSDKISDLNVLIQTKDITKHDALVIVPAGFAARIITEPKQLLVCDTIEQALDSYLAEDNPVVHGVIIRESAGSTSHAAAQFSSQAIPVLHISDHDDINTWKDHAEHPALMIDPQRGQVLLWHKAQGSEEQAKSLLAEGMFTYPVAPVTASSLFTRIPTLENNTSLGTAIRTNPKKTALMLMQKLDATVTRSQDDDRYSQLVTKIDSLEAVKINDANPLALEALKLIRMITFRLAQAEPKILPIFEHVLVLCEEIERSILRYQNNTENTVEHLSLVALLKSLVIYKGDQRFFSDSIMQIMQEKKARELISTNTKLTSIQLEYLTQFLKLMKIAFSSDTQKSWNEFATFCVSTPETIQKLAFIITYSVENQIESSLVNEIFRQYKDDGISYSDILDKLHQDCVNSQKIVQEAKIDQAKQTISSWEKRISEWSDPDKFDLLWQQYQQEIVPLIDTLGMYEEETQIQKKKQSINDNTDDSDDEYYEDDNKETELTSKNWSCHVVDAECSKMEVLNKVHTPLAYVVAGDKLYFVNKAKSLCVLSKMDKSCYEATKENILRDKDKKNGMRTNRITSTVRYGVTSILEDYDFIKPTKFDTVSQKVIFSASLRLTELMDQSIKKLQGSAEYKNDKNLVLRRMAILLEPYHRLMCSWVKAIPDTYFTFWKSYTAYGAGEYNTKAGILSLIRSAFERCSNSSDTRQLIPSGTISIAATVLGTMGSFSRQFPKSKVSLDDLFSLFHQNILSAISIMSGSNKRAFHTLPDQLHEMLEIFHPTDLKLIHVSHKYPHLILEYNLPLGNHAMKLLLDYDQKTQKILIRGNAFGNFAGSEINQLMKLFELEGMLLGVTGKQQPHYSELSHTMNLVWEIDASNLSAFANAFAKGIPQYKGILYHNPRWKHFLYEPIFDKLLKRHPQSSYERLKSSLNWMKERIIDSRKTAQDCGWNYDGSLLAATMLEQLGSPIPELGASRILNNNGENLNSGNALASKAASSQGSQEFKSIDLVPDNSDLNASNKQNNLNPVISTAELQQILNTYKSRSFLGYLSSFWIFSWISPTRSQTMLELKLLLSSSVERQNVSKIQIQSALTLGDRALHRLGLFNETPGTIKDGSGTDEVIVQLREAMKI